MTLEPSLRDTDTLQAILREVMAWGAFLSSLKYENRYVLRDEQYADRLLKELLSKKSVLPARSELFRARKLPVERAGALHAFPPDEMGAPPLSKGGGRFNPDGLRCLYTAEDAQTAIAEVRPWKNAKVAVARFTTECDMEIIDLFAATEGVSASACIQAFAQVVSAPAHEGDPLSYLGTQFVAERLRHEGVTGMRYPSSLRVTGVNLALFNPQHAVARDVVLHEVNSVHYSTSEVSQSSIKVASLFVPR